MKRLALVVLSSLALGGVAFAEDKAATDSMKRDAHTSDKMKGPPNADGAQKGAGGTTDTTGTAGGGAATAKATGEADGKKPGGH